MVQSQAGDCTLPREAHCYYYRARWYDPSLGTFLQTDPIGSLDYVNLYSYVGLEPGNGTDPTGMQGQNGEAAAIGFALLFSDITYKWQLGRTTDLNARLNIASLQANTLRAFGGSGEEAFRTERATRPTILIDPRTIHGTQSSIGPVFRDGRTVAQTAQELRDNPSLASEVDPVRVFRDANGTLRTLDHRRVAAALDAGTSVNSIELTLQEARSESGGAGVRATRTNFGPVSSLRRRAK
jgi:RHS repeat-associated protein